MLEELKGPVQCPFCIKELKEFNFLTRIAAKDDVPVLIAGREPVFECDRCHSIFGVIEE